MSLLKTRVVLICLLICQASLSNDSITALHDYNQKCYDVKDGMAQSAVTDIAILQDGQLLIASYSGLVVFDGFRFSSYIPSTIKQFPRVEAFSLEVEANGVVWVGATSSGLYRIENETVQHWGLEHGLESLLIRDIHVEGKSVFINNDKKLLSLDYEINKFSSIEKEGSLFFDAFKHIENQLIHHENQSYLAKDGKVFSVVDGVETLLISEFIKERPVSISKLMLDTKGSLWIATASNGLFRYSELGLELLTTLPNNRVSSVVEDVDGGIWIGTSGGLCNLSVGALQNIGLEQGLYNENIHSLAIGSNDTVYAIPYGKITQLSVLNKENLANSKLILPEGKDSVIIHSLALDSKDQQWVLTNNSIARFTNNRIEPKIHLDTPARKLLIHKDVFWYQQGNNLVQYDNGLITTLPIPDNNNVDIKSMSVAINGDILVAEKKNIYRATDQDVARIELSVTSGSCIHEFIEDEVWVCSNGLWLMTKNNTYHFNENNNLTNVVNGHIHDVEIDKFGNLWAITNSGLFRLLRKDLDAFLHDTSKPPSFVKFSEKDGMKSSEFNASSSGIVKTLDGDLWLASQAGVVRVDPEMALYKSDKKLTPFIEHFYIGDELIEEKTWGEIAPTSNTSHMHFGAVFLTEAKNLQYRYKLPPFQNEWKLGNSVDLPNLDPGSYQLRVQVKYRQNKWSKSLVRDLVFLPAWYQTNWFKVGSFISALFIVFGLPYWRILSLSKNKKELSKLVDEQTESLLKANKRLKDISVSDELTQIYNRREFISKLDELCRIESNRICLALIDIDDFKSFNDFYGHIPGDDCLVQVAQILNKFNNDTCLVARFGGEEFVMLFDGHTLFEAKEIVKKLYSDLEDAAIIHEKSSVKSIISLSTGIVERYYAERCENIIERADIAMYEAKSSGKDRISLGN